MLQTVACERVTRGKWRTMNIPSWGSPSRHSAFAHAEGLVHVLQTVACEKSYQREMAHNDQPKLVIPIPDEAVGRIIGTSGANLRSLSQRFGVSLAVSSKDNFIPGTRCGTTNIRQIEHSRFPCFAAATCCLHGTRGFEKCITS